MPLPTARRTGRTEVGIEALLFHTLLRVPQQDRRNKWSQGTTKLFPSPGMEMDGEAQPHLGVLSYRSQGFLFPQTHLENGARAPQPQPTFVLPASLLTLVCPTQLMAWERTEGFSAAWASTFWLSSPPPARSQQQGAHLEPCPGWISATHMLRCGFGKHLALGSRPSE